MTTEKLTCIICGRGSSYQITEKAHICNCCGTPFPSKIHPDDMRRVGMKLCVRCFKKDMRLQLHDEIGGFFGDREWTGPENLAAMCKDVELKRWGKYFDATEYMLFKALKDNQDKENDVLMWPDGDVNSLEGRWGKK